MKAERDWVKLQQQEFEATARQDFGLNSYQEVLSLGAFSKIIFSMK